MLFKPLNYYILSSGTSLQRERPGCHRKPTDSAVNGFVEIKPFKRKFQEKSLLSGLVCLNSYGSVCAFMMMMKLPFLPTNRTWLTRKLRKLKNGHLPVWLTNTHTCKLSKWLEPVIIGNKHQSSFLLRVLSACVYFFLDDPKMWYFSYRPILIHVTYFNFFKCFYTVIFYNHGVIYPDFMSLSVYSVTSRDSYTLISWSHDLPLLSHLAPLQSMHMLPN